ncbi:hypothetical protein RFI_11713 [Reticulomyxa filosa]|uniref:Uncharacterized protein n=1 Tax=Reticulomyxa filosa TaxID=46433 RepID=X6NHR3_RETFI|nr:hypothetical protein RFI_11713 [Reticulomyxa filosa]|eukprot:ETO25423.1 hypothetical protein RFI_11713 [Reticulomyxa filosa]
MTETIVVEEPQKENSPQPLSETSISSNLQHTNENEVHVPTEQHENVATNISSSIETNNAQAPLLSDTVKEEAPPDIIPTTSEITQQNEVTENKLAQNNESTDADAQEQEKNSPSKLLQKTVSISKDEVQIIAQEITHYCNIDVCGEQKKGCQREKFTETCVTKNCSEWQTLTKNSELSDEITIEKFLELIEYILQTQATLFVEEHQKSDVADLPIENSGVNVEWNLDISIQQMDNIWKYLDVNNEQKMGYLKFD